MHIPRDLKRGLGHVLDYGEEVRWPRSLGEWSNMVGHEMGFSSAGVYSTAETPSGEELRAQMKSMTWLSIWQLLFLVRGVFS